MAQYHWGSDERLTPQQLSETQNREAAIAALREKRAREQAALEAALLRTQEAGIYSPVISQQAQGADSLQNLAPWQRELVQKLGADQGLPYGFRQGVQQPGDWNTILRALKANQRRAKPPTPPQAAPPKPGY